MHDHHGHASAGDRSMVIAVAVNVLLTIAQVVGGLLAGSLSLVADALHNLSDAMALGIALAARRIARRPSDRTMTFGYVRAEAVAALINYTTLMIVGLYLIYEAIIRLLAPEPVVGWLMIAVAGIALVVDLVTAALTWRLAQGSMNVRAAFVHNVADALGSLGVIVAGVAIVLFGWHVVDPIVTFVIAGYVLWQAWSGIGGAIHMLMLGTPPGIDLDELVAQLRTVDGVCDVHHVHLFAIDEHSNALEAHVVVADDRADEAEAIKRRAKALLGERFGIGHSTLELERTSAGCAGADAQVVGHPVGSA